MKNLFALTLCLALILLAVDSQAEVVFDVSEIAGKSQEDVAKILGTPDQKEQTKRGPRLTYKEGQVEIVFIDGSSDWITLSLFKGVPFNESAIESMGLKKEKPTFKNAFVIRWEPHSIYKSVSLFELDGKIDYAYIKVKTK